MFIKRFRRSATKFSTDSVPKCALISIHEWFAISFREAIPPNHPAGARAPFGDFRSPDPPCPLPPNHGCATGGGISRLVQDR